MSLVRDFGKARLWLRLPPKPFVGGAEIFQMDIERTRGAEAFRLWKGDGSNQVQVSDVDKGRRQLVLQVKEASRRFEERQYFRSRDAAHDYARRVGASLFGEAAVGFLFERWTASSLRRFLCGMDEQHLFIAEFPKGTTVRDAHHALRPDEVREADRSAPGATLRQGEWFFVALSDRETRHLAARLAEMPYALRTRESLGGNGRPHVADEVVREGGRVYARGDVRHLDHKTLRLPLWRRVYRNAEVRTSAVGANGIYWVD